MSEDDSKTKRLDDNYYREIARKAKQQTFDEDKTQLVTSKVSDQSANLSSQSDERTRIYREKGTEDKDLATQESLMADPPVGWLVAVAGPGKGTVLQLGVGMNSVGRGDEPRISIPFLDDQISRGKSFSIAYDEKNRKFHLLPGDGKTLVYLDGKPILEPMELSPHAAFEIGQTKFHFAPLCGDHFSWDGE